MGGRGEGERRLDRQGLPALEHLEDELPGQAGKGLRLCGLIEMPDDEGQADVFQCPGAGRQGGREGRREGRRQGRGAVAHEWEDRSR